MNTIRIVLFVVLVGGIGMAGSFTITPSQRAFAWACQHGVVYGAPRSVTWYRLVACHYGVR